MEAMPDRRFDKTMAMMSAQIRAARALLAWSQDDLAARSGVSAVSIAGAESDRPLAPGDAARVERAFRDAGVVAIPEEGGGAGVRFLRPARAGDQGMTPAELNSANDG